MEAILSQDIDSIVNILLQVSDIVVDISRDNTISGFWGNAGLLKGFAESNPVGKKITEIVDVAVISQLSGPVSDVFQTRQKQTVEYNLISNERLISFHIRLLPIHPSEDHLFIVFEHLHKPKISGPAENDWLLVLNSTSDGFWDIDLETSTIRFSDKWHEKFGYKNGEIQTISDWTSKLHPDDLEQSMRKIEAYLAGKAPFYHTEIRLRGDDGNYKWLLSSGAFISRGSDGKPLRFTGTHTDISEQKIQGEKYQTMSQLLATLIDNLPSGIIVTDEKSSVLFANQEFCNIYKIEAGPASLLGTNVLEGLEVRKLFVKDSERFLHTTKNILSHNVKVLNEEWEFLDGKIYSRDFIPILLGNDKSAGTWKLTDVTQQKNIERRFEEQRNFYEHILNSIPADIAIFSSDYKYLFVNQNAFKNEELRKWMVGKTDIDYARYSNRPDSFYLSRFAQIDEAIARGRQIQKIETLTSKDGKVGHHLRLLRPVYFDDGSFEFIMAYGVNITDLIQAQEDLKTSVETFASAFDYSGIGMALISPDGKWLDANKVLCKLTGYTKEELLQLHYEDITYADDLEIDRGLLNKMIRKEITTYSLEKRYISKEKRIVLVSLTVSLVWNKANTPKFFIAQVVDITKKKELELEIQQKNTELEATKTSLINKIAQLEQLTHIIAHNLRGPAGNIKMLSEILIDRANSDNSESENEMDNSFSVEEGLVLIQESSDALMGSLATLLKIAEIKLNKEIPYQECNVRHIVNDIAAQLHTIIYEKQAEIQFNTSVEVISYPLAYLESIFYNLISNALKYSRPDVPPSITIITRIFEEKTQIVVKDNGLGIDIKKYGNKVFRLNQVFHQGFDSKGVGLYLTKTQIESLGGTIEVFSKPNEGCEFVVTL